MGNQCCSEQKVNTGFTPDPVTVLKNPEETPKLTKMEEIRILRIKNLEK